MDIEQARQFIRENHNAVVCTIRQNGEPAMSPIAVGVDDEGYPIISSRETAYKVKHLRRDPRVSICCLTRQFFGEWLLIRGRAMDGLVDYYRRISGEHPDWDDYRRAMERDKRVLIRVAIEEVGPTRQG
jgi:PPOX class probable F420-dependent enzyme